MVTIARTSVEVQHLARSILDPARRRPIAVVTTLFEGNAPYIDVDELEGAVSDVADIAVVSSGDLTFELAAALPNNCETFNGAVRSFPVGDEWRERPSLARRRFSFALHERQKVLDTVIDDLIGMAHRAGLSVASVADARPASGVVRGMLADDSRAMVQLDDGGVATITAEVTFPPAPLRWVVQEGARVSGHLDPETRRLALETAHPDAASLWAQFPDGSVTLALVQTVERQRATLLVHPEHPVTVTRADLSPNPLDRVDLLLTEGDVIEVRVVRDSQGRQALRTVDLDDDEPVIPAVALTPGSAPWLEAGRPLLEPETELTVTSIEQFLATIGLERAPEVDEPELAQPVGIVASPPSPATAPRPGPGARSAPTPPAPIAPNAPALETAAEKRTALHSALATIDELQAKLRTARGTPTGPSTESLRVENDQLKSLAGELVAEKQRAFDEARILRERLKDAQGSLRAARRTAAEVAPATARDRRSRFADAGQWIRHELYLQWIDRLDPSTRAEHPLTDRLIVGPRFADSLADLDDTQLDKAMRCSMEAASGFIAKVSAREVHALRSGDGASDAPIQRPADGARCMRAYIEQNTPQARRLHYWVLRGGGIELSRVVMHDDVEP